MVGHVAARAALTRAQHGAAARSTAALQRGAQQSDGAAGAAAKLARQLIASLILLHPPERVSLHPTPLVVVCRTFRRMPPCCSACLVAGADDEPRDALTVLPLALPPALAQRIWRALPCDVRLRCREVRPAWRDALAEPRLWTELDLTATSGVVERLTPALLLAAAARADGRLERLCVTYDLRLHTALLAVVEANADTLRLLLLCLKDRRSEFFTGVPMGSLLRAAPRQYLVDANACALNEMLELVRQAKRDVYAEVEQEAHELRNEFRIVAMQAREPARRNST